MKNYATDHTGPLISLGEVQHFYHQTKEITMKYIAISAAIFLSACSAPMDQDLAAHLEAERDFHAHQMYLESIYTKYDPEYIDDCLYYEDLICEFEG